MSTTAFSLFQELFTKIDSQPTMDPQRYNVLSDALKTELNGLDPMAAQEVALDKLSKLNPDTELINLFNEIQEFQSAAMGEGYQFEESHHFVIATIAIAKRICGVEHPGIENLLVLKKKLEEALQDSREIRVLENYIAKNTADFNEFRFKNLEKKIANKELGESSAEYEKLSGDFTHTQQAIAVHYLFHEALGIAGVDTTKLMEFAHLLSAKKIPLNKDTGKENIRNSGIKSAFNRAWKKEDANHLNDLRFVLRFFKPLNVVGAIGIQNAVTAIEKRIARLSEKLNRDKD